MRFAGKSSFFNPIYNRISKIHIVSIFQIHFVKGPKAVLLTRIRYSLKSQQNSNSGRFTKWNLEKSEIRGIRYSVGDSFSKD